MKPTYEIYTLAKGRWIVDARFQGTEKQAAIDEAKRLGTQPGVEQVKVVRESLLDDGLIKESTVFKTTAKSEPPNAKRGAKASYSVAPKQTKPVRRTPRVVKRVLPRATRNCRSELPRLHLPSGTRLAAKLLAIGVASLMVATTTTLLFGYYAGATL